MSQLDVAQVQKQIQDSMAINNGVLQRKCDKCRKKKLLLQRASVQDAPDSVPPIVYEVLRSPGQPLDPETRAFMEPRFGYDFSRTPVHLVDSQASSSGFRIGEANDNYEQEAESTADRVIRAWDVRTQSEPKFWESLDLSRVRIHADAHAFESARSVNSHAFTVGPDIVFGAGQFAPGTDAGRRLLAHELVHVVQQSGVVQAEGPSGIQTASKLIQRRTVCDENGENCQSMPDIDGPEMGVPIPSEAEPIVVPDSDIPGIPIERQLPFINIKRNNIKFDLKTGTDYGHWWTEIDGEESYGWWPDHCPVTIKETLFGTRGDLNGVKGCGGTPKQDPHHGEAADEMFNPKLTGPKTDEQVRSEIRSFARSYSGEWRWTFGSGQNCRSFQRSLMATVGLK